MRLLDYNKMGWEHLISDWRSSFSRADVVVFPDFSLPILYSALDSGNFFVIPGSPVAAWVAESYVKTHSKHNLRASSGYSADDIIVLIVGSSMLYNELSLDYSVVMHTIGPLLVKYGKQVDVGGPFKIIFLCGNSTDKHHNSLEDVAGGLGLRVNSMKQYSMDQDANGVLLMADIAIYGSLQDEQTFPPLLTRIMSLGIPVVVPDLPVISRYVVDGVHGMVFARHNPDDLLRIFPLLVSSEGKLSELADAVGSNAKHLAKNLLAFESIIGYAKLMENVINFPSDALLPAPVSQIQQDSWEWESFERVTEQTAGGITDIDEERNRLEQSSIVYSLEEDLNKFLMLGNLTVDVAHGEVAEHDLVIEDLSVAQQMQSSEEYERRETEEIEERMEKDPGAWDEIYRNARKSEKLRSEPNERDEGELERIGSLICIYEVYNGAGAWPFLHHGSLYRGLSLSTKARRLSSDDVDAVNRLPFLNNSRYRDLLCEMGGLFSIAYKVDEIHKKPWIGFQSWRASGRRVSLSIKAERILEETIQHESKGDTIYFWACLSMDSGHIGTNDSLSFWSMCDVFNGGKCRTAFQDAFRHMYGFPSSVDALPPMPEDHGQWSALHSWVMPTSSFLEFIMFTRIFTDSLDAVHRNTGETTECLLGFSEPEKRHCYCRLLEILINVWAYHSARRMVYIDPHSSMFEEQHPVAQRHGFMWAKYFNFTLLKGMDEDLAEAADDGDFQRDAWLWPLTGEVHWQGIYEREREERYRIKMDKKRKIKEKLLERLKYGYRQKSLGR